MDIIVIRIVQLLKTQYLNAVFLNQLGKWLLNDELSFIGQLTLLSDQRVATSGIGSQIIQLLEKKSRNIFLLNQSKLEFFSIFDRLYEILVRDYGLSKYYFPRENDIVDYLCIWQRPLVI